MSLRTWFRDWLNAPSKKEVAQYLAQKEERTALAVSRMAGRMLRRISEIEASREARQQAGSSPSSRPEDVPPGREGSSPANPSDPGSAPSPKGDA